MLFLDDTESAPLSSYRSVARRKTDLMPTIPSPRESSFGSRSSLYCHTPRTPGMQKLKKKKKTLVININHSRLLFPVQMKTIHFLVTQNLNFFFYI